MVFQKSVKVILSASVILLTSISLFAAKSEQLELPNGTVISLPERANDFDQKLRTSLEASLVNDLFALKDPSKKQKLVTPIPIRGSIGECNGKKIYFLDFAEVKLRDLNGIERPPFERSGSAGFSFEILAAAKGDTKFARLFTDTVVSYLGIKDKAEKCPVIQLLVHPSKLNSAKLGPQPAELVFDSKANQYNLRNGSQ